MEICNPPISPFKKVGIKERTFWRRESTNEVMYYLPKNRQNQE